MAALESRLNGTVTPARVAFANPDHLPWMGEAATAFHLEGTLSRYFAPPAFPTRVLDSLEQRLGPLGGLAARHLRRRSPAELPQDVIARAGTFAELSAVVAKRVGLRNSRASHFAERRDAAFDRGVARQVEDLDAEAISIGFGAARLTARAAPHSVLALLDYPLTHHAYAKCALNTDLVEHDRMGVAARKRADNFTWGRYVREFSKIIGEAYCG